MAQLIRPKFNTVFKTFAQAGLILDKYKVDRASLTEDQFDLLTAIMGSTQMRYKTDVRNQLLFAMKVKEFSAIYKRQKEVYDQSLDDQLTEDLEVDNRVYNVDSAEAGVVSDNYLAGANKSNQKRKIPKIDRLDEMKKRADMKDPELIYINSLARALAYPLAKSEGDL